MQAKQERSDREHAHRRLDPRQLIADADRDVPWRCRPLLADGHLTVLASRGGEGKSLLSLALGKGVLAGQPVGGIPAR